MSYPFRLLLASCCQRTSSRHPFRPIVAIVAGGTSNIRQKGYTNQILGRIICLVTFRRIRRTEEKRAEEDDLGDQEQHERQRVGCKQGRRRRCRHHSIRYWSGYRPKDGEDESTRGYCQRTTFDSITLPPHRERVQRANNVEVVDNEIDHDADCRDVDDDSGHKNATNVEQHDGKDGADCDDIFNNGRCGCGDLASSGAQTYRLRIGNARHDLHLSVERGRRTLGGGAGGVEDTPQPDRSGVTGVGRGSSV